MVDFNRKRQVVEQGGVEYIWRGGFGDTLTSYEKGVVPGTVRLVGKRLVHAWAVLKRRRFTRQREIWWCLVEPGDGMDGIRAYRKELFDE